MLPAIFAGNIAAGCADSFHARSMEQPWPDESIQLHGSRPAFERLHEIQPDPDPASAVSAGPCRTPLRVEPVRPDWLVLRVPSVTLTPHIAGFSMRTATFAAEQATEEGWRPSLGALLLHPC